MTWRLCSWKLGANPARIRLAPPRLNGLDSAGADASPGPTWRIRAGHEWAPLRELKRIDFLVVKVA